MFYMQAKRVIIVGGGFGGVETARHLAGVPGIDVVLISEHTHLEYYPGVFRLMKGAPSEFVEIPLSDIFVDEKNITIIQSTVTSIDPVAKSVTLSDGVVHTADYLVLSVGSQSTYFNIPGVEATTLPLRRGADVRGLMRHAEHLFKSHATAPREEQVVAFRFVVVGGGPSGVELAAELADYTRELAHTYNVHPSLITIDLIESKERVLGMLPVGVSEAAERRLRNLGVSLHRNRTVVRNDSWTIELTDSHLGARSVIWTAGVEVRQEAKAIPGFEYGARGRIVVNQFMEAKGHLGVYAIGDISDTPYSGLAQTAIRQAICVARNIRRELRGRSKQAIVHKTAAFAIPLGMNHGIFGIGNWYITGYFAWLMRSIIDFKYISSITSIPWVIKHLIIPTVFKKKDK
jgi:NADH:ubiquinone reductase (H+-translocating)